MKYYFFSYVLNIPGKGFEFGNGTSRQQDDEFFDIYLIQNKIEEYSTDECSACILHYNEMSESDYKGLQSSKHIHYEQKYIYLHESIDEDISKHGV